MPHYVSPLDAREMLGVYAQDFQKYGWERVYQYFDDVEGDLLAPPQEAGHHNRRQKKRPLCLVSVPLRGAKGRNCGKKAKPTNLC